MDLLNVQCVTKYIWSRTRCRQQFSSQCLIGDAILPQTGTKLTKNSASKLGTLLWRHLMPKAKKRNIAAQVQSILYTNVRKRFRKNWLPVWLTVCTNLFIPSRFWTTDANIWHLLSAIHSDLQKKLYIGAHLQSRPCSTAVDFFSKTLSYPYDLVRTNFSADFFDLRNFLTANSWRLWCRLPTNMHTK